MKPIRSLLVVPVTVALGAMLVSGCYTQLALNNDDSEAVADSEWTEVVQPPPTAIFVEPIYVPIRPSFAPLPVATRSGSGTGTQTSPQPSQRDIGSQRSGSSSGQASSSTPVRSNGSTRGGR